jgi:hypothetical protein
MKRELKRFFNIGIRFKREFKRQLRMIIIISLGFTIAFTWRQTIFDLSQAIVNFFLHLKNPSTSSILTSLFITVLSMILIYFASHYLKDSYENY